MLSNRGTDKPIQRSSYKLNTNTLKKILSLLYHAVITDFHHQHCEAARDTAKTYRTFQVCVFACARVCVSLSVEHTEELCKTDEQIEMPSGEQIRVGVNYVATWQMSLNNPYTLR